MLPGHLDQLRVEIGDENLLFVVRCLGQDASEWVGDEAASPKLEAGLRGVVAGPMELHGRGISVGGDDLELDVAVLVAGAVDGADEDPVGDGVGALGGLPGFILGGAELVLLRGVPADGGGKEEDFGAFEGGEASAFGVPLIPADESSDGALRGAGGFEAEVTRGEVELFVIEGIVGDVHLAIDIGDAAVLFDGDGGVVIEAGGAAFEERGDEDDAGFAADAGEDVGGGAGNRLGEAEEVVVFALAEVLGPEELREANERGSLAGGLIDALGGLVEVDHRVWVAGHLDEGDALDFVGCGHSNSIRFYRLRGGTPSPSNVCKVFNLHDLDSDLRVARRRPKQKNLYFSDAIPPKYSF